MIPEKEGSFFLASFFFNRTCYSVDPENSSFVATTTAPQSTSATLFFLRIFFCRMQRFKTKRRSKPKQQTKTKKVSHYQNGKSTSNSPFCQKDLSVSLCGARRHDHCIFIVDFFPQPQQEIQFLFLLIFKVQLFFVFLNFDPDFILPTPPPPCPSRL